jgi:HTH-type transcriptional regulator/antitoxin HigA
MVPTVIKSDAQYREYLARMSDLVSIDPELGTSAGDELELLALIVEKYEKEKFRIERPTPVDAILHRMHEQGLRQADLVPYFGSRSRASEVLSGKRPLTIPMIRALADGLSIPVDVLVGKEEPSEETEAEHAKGDDALIDWSRLPAKEMAVRGYFGHSPGRSKTALIEQARAFVVSAIGAAGERPIFARRTMKGEAVSPRARYGLLAWKARVLSLARARRQAGQIEKFRLEKVSEEFLDQLVRLSWHSKGPRLARELLEGIGIAVVFVRQFPGTCLDGAALLDLDGQPVIGLTLRFDRLDHFWFTLLHEVVHVWKHLGDPGEAYLDRLEDKEAVDSVEKEANRLARDLLIPRAVWKRSEIVRQPTAQAVLQLSEELRVSPAIVAGRLRRETGNYSVLGDMLGQKALVKLFEEEIAV